MTESLASVDDALQTNGVSMLELGTWQSTNIDEYRDAMQTTLEMGHQHINTIQAYRNEAEVGESITATDIDRDEAFLATKVWADGLSHDNVVESTEAGLGKLGVDCVDLLYAYWPSREYNAERTFVTFDELVEQGLAGCAGISNFELEQTREVVELSESGVFASQIEMHPPSQQEGLREVCTKEDIESIAYSSLACGEVSDVGVLSGIAERRDAGKAQVSLAWSCEEGVTAIPKMTDEIYTRDNWELLALELDDEDVTVIDAIDIENRHIDFDFMPR